MTQHLLTFLFTDLENSIPLRENFPNANLKAYTLPDHE
jgi:hypothetical protein